LANSGGLSLREVESHPGEKDVAPSPSINDGYASSLATNEIAIPERGINDPRRTAFGGPTRMHRSSVLAAIIVGLTTAAILNEGAFHTADAAVVGTVSCVLIALQLPVRSDRAVRLVMAAIGALTLWWLIAAAIHGTGGNFLPLGASMVGFLGAFLIIGNLDFPKREAMTRALVAIGASVAILGLVALALRWYPLAIKSDSTWRLSSTLTYYNAAGILVAMVLLLALSLDPALWRTRVAIYICAVGLLATQSRGAILALIIGLVFVPREQLRKCLLPLLSALLAGLLVVIVSHNDRLHPLLLVPIAVGALISARAYRSRQMATETRSRRVVLISLLVAGAAVVAVWFSLHPELTRVNALDNGDRIAIWVSALHQWWSSPYIGVGADRLLQVRYFVADGTRAAFAHNEYLQVLADGGVIGAALLVTAGASIARSVHRANLLTSCAIGALVAFAVAGVFDFVWHLPALGLVGGCVAGLAERKRS